MDKNTIDTHGSEHVEDWTYNGMKIRNFQQIFNNMNDFVESFETEDGQEFMSVTHQRDWTDEMKELAKLRGII